MAQTEIGHQRPATGKLAERLQAQRHDVVALVSRCEAARLVSGTQT
jgi:hypothetical protein